VGASARKEKYVGFLLLGEVFITLLYIKAEGEKHLWQREL